MNSTSIKIDIPAVAIVILLFCIYADGGEPTTLPRSTRGSQSSIHFYGKLVDQNENPVEGARIIYDIEKYGFVFPSVSRKSVKTGKDGLFMIRGGNAAKLRILDAILDGYEYLWQNNEHLFEYRSYYDSDIRHTPDKSNPVVLHIRKRESECCCVLETGLDVDIKAGDKENCMGYDLFTCKQKKYPQSDSSDAWDLEVFAVNETEQNQWLLNFRTPKKNSGIQKSAKQLFMVPEDGYVNEVSFPIKYTKNSYAQKLFLFIKSDSPTAYMRLDVKYESDSERIRIRSKLFMNPYGERLLESVAPFSDWRDEYSPNLLKLRSHEKKFEAGMSVYMPIEQVAKDARHNRKLAAKPDISNHLKEGILIFKDRRHY